MNAVELRVRVLLTLQVALLGMVSPNMRAVLVSWTESDVHVRVLFDGGVSSLEDELVSEIESEVMSHLPDYNVRCMAESCSTSEKVMPANGEVLVFQRAPVR